MLLEICATNIQSALNAQRAGAHRLELCAAIDTGGLTPSPGLIGAVVAAVQIPVNVLIRPREGNFCYNRDELLIMLDDIAFSQDYGANGIVVGALTAKGFLDLHAMEMMIAAAGDMEVTCHRAFDFTNDPFAAMEALIDIGVTRILTSGQASSAYEGRFLLQKLVEKADARVSIMPGAGINESNIAELKTVTAATEFHLSARKKITQHTHHHLQGLDWGYWESDEVLIQKVMGKIAI